MTTYKEVLEYSENRLEKLVLGIMYQFKSTTIDELKELTEESLLTLYPTVRRLEEKGLLTRLDSSSQERYKLTI